MFKVSSSTTYHILLAELGELPMEIYALKANYRLSTTLLLVSK